MIIALPTEEISNLKDILDYRTAIAFLSILTIACAAEFGILLRVMAKNGKDMRAIDEGHAKEIKELNEGFARQLTAAKDAHLATAVQSIPATQRMIPLVEELVKILQEEQRRKDQRGGVKKAVGGGNVNGP